MSSIIRRRRGLMRVSVMGVLPELGLNTQSSDSSPLSVTAPLIAPGTPLRVALYRESGLVRRAEAEFLGEDDAIQQKIGQFRGVGRPGGKFRHQQLSRRRS